MLQVVEVSKISRQLAHEGGKVISPTHRLPLPPQEISLVLIYVRGWVDPRAIIRTGGLRQWKFRITLSGIEPATFRLLEHCVNQLHQYLHYWFSIRIYRNKTSWFKSICHTNIALTQTYQLIANCKRNVSGLHLVRFHEMGSLNIE